MKSNMKPKRIRKVTQSHLNLLTASQFTQNQHHLFCQKRIQKRYLSEGLAIWDVRFRELLLNRSLMISACNDIREPTSHSGKLRQGKPQLN